VSAEQPKTLSEWRADYIRMLRDIEAEKGGTITISDEYPATVEDRARQIDGLKNVIARIDEALELGA
jgi:hypothetical protein